MSPLISYILTLLIMELTLKYLEFDLDGHIPGRHPVLWHCILIKCGDHVMDLEVRTKVISEVLKFSPTSTELRTEWNTQHFYVISCKVPVTDVDSRW